VNFSLWSKKQKLLFLSGVFEGEGSFGYWKNGSNRKRIELSISMTDLDIIERFQVFFNVGSSRKIKLRHHHKQAWSWSVSGLHALQVLEQMIPFLGKRRTKKYYDMVESFRVSVQNGDHGIRKQTKRKTSYLTGKITARREDVSRRNRAQASSI